MPEVPHEFRGLWVATVDNIDWPSEPGLSADQQRAEAIAIIEVADELNLNAILLQVRPSADAFYRSNREPWSAYLTGEQGRNPGYDPLRFWIDHAHARGIELHAWVNPFRAWHPSSPGQASPRSVLVRHPELVRTYGDLVWLDPGEPEARAHSLAVITDLVRRYDIDGIMLDDYFYPYPIEGQPFPDEQTYADYTKAGGERPKGEWRRWNIDRFVRDFDAAVKRLKPGVRVEISPFGIWRPDHPRSVSGFDAYERLSADARRWMHEGWLDVSSPQLYWRLDSAGQPFEPLLRWWQRHNASSRFLWPSLFLTRIKQDSGWAPDEIVRQIQTIRRNHASGFILFSAIGLLENRQDIATALRRGPLDHPAIVPTAGWLPQPDIGAPILHINQSTGRTTFRWRPAPDNRHAVRRWILSVRYGDRWHSTVLPPTQRSATYENHRGEEALLGAALRQVCVGGRVGPPRIMSRLIPPPATPTSSRPLEPHDSHPAQIPASTPDRPTKSAPD